MKDLIRIVRFSNQYKNFATKGSDITGKHCKFILFICHNEGLTQEEIAFSMGIDKSNAARRLSELEENGYIKRTVKKEDKRNLEIYPTEKAMRILPYIKNIVTRWNDYITEDLSETEKEQFYSIAQKMQNKAVKWQEHNFMLPLLPEEMMK